MHRRAKTLIGQPRDVQPDLRLYCSHRYKAVFTICFTYFGAGWTSTSHQKNPANLQIENRRTFVASL